MARSAYMNLRVRPALKAKLEKLAKEDRRSFSSYVKMVLEDHVKARQASSKAVERNRPKLIRRSERHPTEGAEILSFDGKGDPIRSPCALVSRAPSPPATIASQRLLASVQKNHASTIEHLLKLNHPTARKNTLTD